VLSAVAFAVAGTVALAPGCERTAFDAAGNPSATIAKPASALRPPVRFDAGDANAGAVLPADIARGLSTDAGVLDCAEGTRGAVSAFAPDWVAARRVDLDDDGRGDWVVQGRHACLADADGAAWWVYADDGAQRRLLLAAGRGRALELLDSRTQGFHDLVVHARDGAQPLVYDGAAYVPGPLDVRTGAATGGLTAERFAVPLRGRTVGIATVAGALEITPLEAGDSDTHVVRLDGRELLRTGTGGEFADFPLPHVLARFRGVAPFDEVLVFQQQMYGNACNGGPLWILALRAGDAPVRTAAIDYCGGAAPILDASRAVLLVTLPGAPASGLVAGEAPQRWEFRDGELRRLATP
jgi:hypothetical protein